ncbi:hypothetical protein HRI_001944600 [Hibiscus trionum]|uniref:Retroviral polymerase SH3-like domain-containing protein n=1 Tax=Hibiscus trionum TaxID=183268 RepID=A0A9W7HSL6_HIBTR|nr:hypothetical protein HRI_001944600 [Hibiscus trionum]
MASENFVQPTIPHFDGHYDHWGMLMENFLRSKEYWQVVSDGIPELTAAMTYAQKTEIEGMKLKDLKAKNYLFQAIDRSILETILCKDTSKQIWDSMKKKYEGSAKAKRQQLQTLRTEFDNLKMKSGESIAIYFSRVMAITNKMRVFEDKLEDIIIIEKILRSLTPKFNFVVCAIEESKNIDELSLDELQSSLLVHEQKIKQQDIEEQALQASTEYHSMSKGGRGGRRGRGRGRGGHNSTTHQQKSVDKSNVECYRCHRSPTFSVQNQTPEKAWGGRKPSVDHFRIFGCIAYAHVPDAKRSKLDDKGEKCIFLGVCEQSKAYKLYNPITKKIVISHDVVFNEAEFWSHDECKREQRIHVDFEDGDEETRQQVETNDEQIVTEEIPAVGAVERAQRVKKRPAWMQDYVIPGIDQYDDPVVHFALFSNFDPVTFEEAVKKLKWREAMNDEIAAIEKNNTWELTELPKGQEAIDVKKLMGVCSFNEPN